MLTFVHHRGVIVVVADGRIHTGESGLIGVDKLLLFTGRQQHVIRGDTGLTGIQGFAETDALNGVFHAGTRRDNGR